MSKHKTELDKYYKIESDLQSSKTNIEEEVKLYISLLYIDLFIAQKYTSYYYNNDS